MVMSPKDNITSWIKSNIFSLITLTGTVISLISAGAVMKFQFKQSLTDIDQLKKDMKEVQAIGKIEDLRKIIDDKVFIMKTEVYKEVEKMDVLFTEKLRNSERREQEIKQDIKDLREMLYKYRKK
jgi:hypothetical protein